jgi:hypothetical protein
VAGYDRVGELNGNDLIGPWLAGLLPAAGAGRHAVLLPGKYLRDGVRSR